MPAPIVAPVQVDALVKRVEKAGNAFSQRAVELSSTIEAIAQRLELMNGKLAVEVNEDDVWVSFFKPGGNWGLYLSDAETRENAGNDDAIEPLLSVSILRKARAFRPLLKLLEEIEAEQRRQYEIVDSALAALATLEKRAIPQSLIEFWYQACEIVGGLAGDSGKQACSAVTMEPRTFVVAFPEKYNIGMDLCSRPDKAEQFTKALAQVLGHPVDLTFAFVHETDVTKPNGRPVPPPPKPAPSKLPPPPHKGEGK